MQLAHQIDCDSCYKIGEFIQNTDTDDDGGQKLFMRAVFSDEDPNMMGCTSNVDSFGFNRQDNGMDDNFFI